MNYPYFHTSTLIKRALLPTLFIVAITGVAHGTPIQHTQYTLIGSSPSGASGTFTLNNPLGQFPDIFVHWDLVFAGVEFEGFGDGSCLNTTGYSQCRLEINNPNIPFGGSLDMTVMGDEYGGLFRAIVADFPIPFTGSFVPVPEPIPEPATMWLFASGLLGLAAYQWLQRRRERAQVG